MRLEVDGVECGPGTRGAGTMPPAGCLAAAALVALALAACDSGKIAAAGAEHAPAVRAAAEAPAVAAAGASTSSLWSADAAAPARLDAGPDLPVELGVRFRSSVAGVVTGVRFFKGAANAGPHVGSLWSASGQRLASATFTSETAAGWQQVSFAAPVAIEAGKYYVASYHCPAGHYAVDVGDFAAEGRTRPPLEAPSAADGGGNGLVGYGPAGTFPHLAAGASNYWVDVMFTPGAAPALQSLAVAPGSASLLVGQTLQLAAVATYSDGSTQEVNSQAAWSTLAPSIASVSAAGLATGLGAGPVTLRASFGGQSASATVRVRATALAITTVDLPGTGIGTAYSVTLTAVGGTPPYRWNVPSGLPDGLTLDGTTGVLAGIAQEAGSFPLTVQLTDSASASVIRDLSIEILSDVGAMLWPGGKPLAFAGSDRPITLGVRFRSDVAGSIAGVRFYKTAGNVGPHVGGLWRADGTLLAQAPFSAETSSGWQTVTFAAPVAIQAGATYVASYHTTSGFYAADPAAFTGTGRDLPPLHAPASTPSAPNGVFRYGSTPSFPDQGWRDTSFWVDVLFEPAAGPSLQSVSVAPASPSVAVGSRLQLAATAHYSNGTVSDVTGAATWSSSAPRIAGVSGGVLAAFNAGGATITASFGGRSGAAAVTVGPGTPPPPSGPGGPILVITHAANPFSAYLAEILKAEGLNEYRAMDIASVTPAVLAGYDVAVLGELPLTAAQATVLSDWVNAGGNLVAMRPDEQLASVLGLSASSSTVSDGYLLVDTRAPPGAGIVDQTMQFHGTAGLYALAGATAVATLYTTATAATNAPAISLHPAGLGMAAAFTYDLARSVVLTRQGNPAWSGQERDGAPPIRSDDLFFGGDGAPDWVDLSKVAIPQADEQQRLLANLVVHMTASRKPLPRFWYFPSGHKAVVVMTGDDHANAGTIGRMDDYADASAPGCSLQDWECIRSTSYVYAWTDIASADVAAAQAEGFEIALHVTTNCEDWSSQAALEEFYADELADFAVAFPKAAAPVTSRTHCIVWSDYDSQPRVELAHGIRLDTTYYYWPGSWVGDRPGFMTGSGIPMRFATRDGELLDVYQAATQMTDESDQSYPFTVDTLLDRALGPEGYYGVFTANMHTDVVASADSDAIVGSAVHRGVPIVSARQLLTWLDGRDASSFVSIAWAGNVLTFRVVAGAGARNLRGMVPASAGAATLQTLTRDGADVPFTVQPVKGVRYAFFPATDGAYVATYR